MNSRIRFFRLGGGGFDLSLGSRACGWFFAAISSNESTMERMLIWV